MAFKGKTFNFQSVTAGDDGYLYDILSGRRNILFAVAGGNPFTISNNVLTIAQSYLLISGRAIRIEGNTTISLGSIPTSATKGRVIIRLDMLKLATETTFRQIETEVETTSGSFRALVQQNINSINGQSGNKYEEVICTFTCSSGVASAPIRTLVSGTGEQISSLIPFGTYNTLNQEITLYDSFQNYRKLQFRFGANTTTTSGGGAVIQEIDIQHHSTYNSSQFGFVYFVNGAIATMSFEINPSSPTKVKIIGLSGASGSGLRCIYGIK